MRNRLHLPAERLLLAAGAILLLGTAAALIHRFVLSNRALVEFDQARDALIKDGLRPNAGGRSDGVVDLTLWSEKRIRAYHESLLVKTAEPLAVLRIEKLNIRVPVFEGTNDFVLNRGTGWITGTGRPGAVGNHNIGIAGHRDGFFRGFKDIAVGDAVELSTTAALSNYVVDGIEIVYPDNVGVLRPRGSPSLTLVTCYPFYFIGDAPQRFIVHATLKEQVGVQKLTDSGSASARTETIRN